MSLKVLIIDDEELARQRLKHLIKSNDRIQIIGECVDGLSALEAIDRDRPDLIFLDIEMPGITGLEVLKRIQHQPKVIFTTAYDQYAIEAFEFNSLAYLLKPIDSEKLSKALDKIQETKIQGSGEQRDQILEMLQQFLAKQEDTYLRRLQVKIGDRILLLGLDEILFFESEDKYTTVVTDSRRHIIDTPLVDLETQLDPQKFIRIHRSCIVNVDWVAEIQRHIGGKLQLLLRDQSKSLLTVSRSYVDRVRSL